MLKRIAMVAATAFLSINLWTGAPLFALWVGSQVVGQTALSMQAVFVVVIVLAVARLLDGDGARLAEHEPTTGSAVASRANGRCPGCAA